MQPAFASSSDGPPRDFEALAGEADFYDGGYDMPSVGGGQSGRGAGGSGSGGAGSGAGRSVGGGGGGPTSSGAGASSHGPSSYGSGSPPSSNASFGGGSSQAAQTLWLAALEQIEDMTADYARSAERVRMSGPDRLLVAFRAENSLHKQSCERPDRKLKIEQALSAVAGRPVTLEFELLAAAARTFERRPAQANRVQRMRELEKHPLVSQAKAMFDAEVIDVGEPRQTE